MIYGSQQSFFSGTWNCSSWYWKTTGLDFQQVLSIYFWFLKNNSHILKFPSHKILIHIKNIVYLSKTVVNYEATWWPFWAQASRIKKCSHKKISYILGNGTSWVCAKMFFSKESSSYISGNGNRKRITDISGNETFSYFKLKTSYILGSNDFFYKLNQSTLLVHTNIESLLLCLFFFQLYIRSPLNVFLMMLLTFSKNSR